MNVDIIKEFTIYKDIKQEISSFNNINDYPINDYIQFEREYKLNTILNET